MLPKFTIDKSDRIYITDKYVCNGHWLVDRVNARSQSMPIFDRMFKPVLNLQHGAYYDGIACGVTNGGQLPAFEQVIPKRDGYKICFEQAQGVEFRADSDEILAYKFQTQDGAVTVGIAPKYVPLLRLGKVYAKEAISPLIVLSDGINSELLAVVMPMRLENMKKN